MMLYSVAIRQEQESGAFLAVVPDLPSVEVGGTSMAGVIGDVRLAIIEHLQSLVSNNQPIPAGQDIGVHLGDSRFLGHTWAIVSIDSLRLSQHLIPVELALPKSLILSICHEVGCEGCMGCDENETPNIPSDVLSAFITEAIKERLKHSKRH